MDIPWLMRWLQDYILQVWNIVIPHTDIVVHFAPANFEKYRPFVIGLVLVTAPLMCRVKHSQQSVDWMIIMSLLLAMLGLTECLRTITLFSTGLWNPDLKKLYQWLYECNPFMKCFCLTFALIGGNAMIKVSKPWWHVILDYKVKIPIIDNPLSQALVFAIVCVVTCACGPGLQSVAFIGFLITLCCGFVASVAWIVEELEKHKASSAPTAGTPAAVGRAPAGSVSISNSSRVNQVWTKHIFGKNLNEGKDIKVFTKACTGANAAERNKKILFLFKKTLEDNGFAVHSNLTA